MDSIFPDGINGFHQFSACFAIKQAGEQDGLVERRFHQDGFAFHIAVLLDVMDDLLHESDLLCILMNLENACMAASWSSFATLRTSRPNGVSLNSRA